MSAQKIVVLATGGTLAGVGPSPDAPGYTAAQLGIGTLLAGIPALAGQRLEAEQVAQVDSKDMSLAIWAQLAERTAHHLARPEVAGLVVTHGTDTLEETAFLLQAVLAPAKPVVITGAMRPATARDADGPRNLCDAVALAADAAFAGLKPGVVAVCAGVVHEALHVHKAHPTAMDPYRSGAAGPLGRMVDGRFTALRAPAGATDTLGVLGSNWAPVGVQQRLGAIKTVALAAAWPRVAIVFSHAGADGDVVRALRAQGVDGLVVAATGNGTVHEALGAALAEAQAEGLPVWVSSRCEEAPPVPRTEDGLRRVALSPVKARIALMLDLIAQRAG